MRTLWLLNELGVEFEVETHGFDKSLRQQSYLDMSPAGRVPALEVGETMMFESGAMAEYLCEVFPAAGLGRLPNDPERAEWLMWIHFAETMSVHAANLTQQHIVLYEPWMRSETVMRLEAKRLAKTYAAVDAKLGARPYLLESGFSAADIGIGQAIYMGQRFASIQGLDALGAWYERITQRAGFQESLPPEGAALLYAQDFYPPPEEAR